MLLSSAQGWTINYPFPLVLGLSALCMCSLTSWFQGEVTQTLLFKHPGVESNDLPLSSLLWLRGAASRCGKCSRPRPLLVRCSGHAEAGGGGGCGCIFAERVLWLRRARGGCWPHCPPGSQSLRVALTRGSTSRPALRAAHPGAPRPPPSAGRAGGVVRAARVTALSSRGASTGLSVTAPNALCAQSAAGRQPCRSDVLRALASVRARPLTTRVRALVATLLLSTRRQWTREPPRKSTVGAAPVAADAGLGRVDARGRRCSWPGSGMCPGRGRMWGPAASLFRLGSGAHVESQQDRQRGPRLSWWPQVLDEGSKSHPLQTFLPRFQDVFLGL